MAAISSASAEAADGLVGDGGGFVELAVGDHVGDHRGVERAGADGVDADAAWGVLEGGAAGEADDAVLGGVVGGSAGEADETAERRAVDDGAAALGAHLAELVLHAGPHAAEVDGVDPVEQVGGFVGGVGGWGLDAGVVERHVEPAERGDGAVDHRGDLVLVGDVAGDAEHLVSGGLQVVGGGAASGVVVVAARTTAAPASAKARAVARPMPELAPVTRATWPVKS